MVLQASGTISLSNIQAEFGGVPPTQFSEYFAGGAYVPSGTSGVPSSGQMSFSQFYGKSSVSKTVATGGTVSTITDGGKTYKLHTFSYCNYPSGGSFVVTTGGNIEFLLVAGGGGGGEGRSAENISQVFGGGGGGGGAVGISNASCTPGTYAITVGKGGDAGNWAATYPGAGGASQVWRSDTGTIFYVYGGGRGGFPGSNNSGAGAGGDGGCGGGASLNLSTMSSASGGAAYPITVNNLARGSAGMTGYYSAGTFVAASGGGALGGGYTSSGIVTSFTGTSMTFGEGGAGGTNLTNISTAQGVSGGGSGNNGGVSATQGVDGTGGGGGGGGGGPGARGGHGVVYIRYLA